jgi:two-component system chemotaxis response regulator CheB
MPIENKIQAILIGGSAGSYETIAHLLEFPQRAAAMPPVIVVLHRMRNVDSNIIELLRARTGKDSISEAEEKQQILPGRIYIAPANYHLLVEEDRTFCLDNSAPVNFCRPSIDVMFESASLVYRTGLLGILLSGSNDDGSYGMRCIERKGGIVVVEDPEEAEFKTMPLAGIRGLAKPRILKVHEIEDLLIKL